MEKVKGNIVDLEKKDVFFGEFFIKDGFVFDLVKISKEKKFEKYIIPGFVDSHIHIESSMLVPSEFAKVAVRTGVIATVSDPHEIANVLGVDGVEYMRLNGERSGFKFFFGVPSCVPAVPFDKSGAVLDSRIVTKMLESGKYFYLSEMMNFPGVVNGDVEVKAKIDAALRYGLKVDGHAPGLIGADLETYVNAGITTDHECMSLQEAEDKIKLGVKVQIREGSAAKNFDSLIDIVKKYPDMVMLCSDDCHPDDLLNGYFVGLVRRALKKGVDVFDVLRISGYNAIKHYNLPLGLLQEGDPADFVMVDNLLDFNVEKTVVGGKVLFEKGNVKTIDAKIEIVNNFIENIVRLEDIKVSSSQNDSVSVRVIGVVEGELYTNSEVYDLEVQNGNVTSDRNSDILKIVVLNRYQKAKPSVGFIKGFGLKQGAICSSVSHDSHNLVAIGVDDESIVKVINGVVASKGGLAYADDDVLKVLELPVAGLMAAASAEKVAEDYRNLLEITRKSGSTMKAPFMTMAFMSLIVIPELKISDQGLFDVVAFKPTSLFANER
ncbi:adenine deaminase [uncultured Acetobacteroides sp.]|uniref:adenine deaminase n=1 Tax=uncultured Acetobacteroides sp. TaxID=1760811 RepID=UPI0029F4E3B2|nr:adenine deaminase [uncultured Acetobacteroides sp.]